LPVKGKIRLRDRLCIHGIWVGGRGIIEIHIESPYRWKNWSRGISYL